MGNDLPGKVIARAHTRPESIEQNPKKIPAENFKSFPASEPNRRLIKSNIYNLDAPQRKKVEEFDETFPQIDTILLNDKIDPEEHAKLAGFSNIVVAKDAYIKDQNSENFSIYNKLQGLPHDVIRCLVQDNDGNVWFGTYGGGVTKFDGTNFTYFTLTQGMFSNFILSVYQDSESNIWFGTMGNGLIKFDGKYFVQFTKKNGLPENNITSILQDKGGKIWFGTSSEGLCSFDGKTFINFKDKSNPARNQINCLYDDNLGNIWFGTSGGGAFNYDGMIFTNFTKEQGLLSDTVFSIIGDSKGNVWFGTARGGISCLTNHPEAKSDLTKKEFVQPLFNKNNPLFILNYNQSECFGTSDIYSIIEDKDGNLWFGTNGNGLTLFDRTKYTHFTENEGLGNTIIYDILQDRSGKIWIATDGGVSKYNGNIFRHYHKKDGLINATVHSLYEDECDNLWFGTEGGGISILRNYKTEAVVREMSYITKNEGLKRNNVYGISADHSGNLWFASYFSGISIYHGNCKTSERKYYTYIMSTDGLPSNNINCIFHDKKGNTWIGTNDAGVSKYDGKSFSNYTDSNGLVHNRISCIAEDKAGNIWIGTLGGGVSKYNGKTFANYSVDEGLAGNDINSVLVDRKGNVWLGTNGGGISVYFDDPSDSHKQYFLNISDKDGLSNNAVLSIMQDKTGNIWFGTRFGIGKLSSENQDLLLQNKNVLNPGNKMGKLQPVLFKNYTYDDGFHGIGCNRSAIYQDKTGTIWIGANDRLTEFHPELDQPDTIAPNIQLLNIQLFNENISWSNFINRPDTSLILDNGVVIKNLSFDNTSAWYGLPLNLSLSHNNNFLTFRFIGITQKQSKKVKYQYKLQGLDDNWSNLSEKNEVTYGNLPHGNYKFIVKAMNSEGYWSKEFNYQFTIRPPWWKSKWFEIFSVFFGFTVFFSFYKWRTGSLKKQKKILEFNVKEKTKEVVLQKEELEAINEELSASNEELHNQREELESTLEKLQNAQLQIIQSEKMASLGILAAGVAHEINNPLNFIQGGIEAIQTYFDQNLKDHMDEVSPLIQGVQVGVSRAASIVTSLNRYSRMDSDNMTECNIHTIIDNCLVMLNNQTKNRIEILKKFHSEPLIITGNESKLHQALLNILANAVQAIEKEGTIRITTESELDKICIAIEDNGCGIEKKDMNKIYDPFFTTKEPGKGTGLGLSITYNIITEHDGTIEFTSNIGVGTKVLIHIPFNENKNRNDSSEIKIDDK